ncbi:hypothetical protein [Priestia flexa]|uniref:hypothetical protein n=1 Tax=Priestia flexa TaxID=86664 RepID=UPI0013D5AF27|nr:hypothetical protein [Priestia flexa]
MLNLEPYVYFKKICIKDVEALYNHLNYLESLNLKNEGYYDLEREGDLLTFSYYKAMFTKNLVFDDFKEHLINQDTTMLTKMDIRINVKDEVALFFGKSNFEKITISKIFPDEIISIIDEEVDFKVLYQNFINLSHQITSVAFEELSIGGINVRRAKFEMLSNEDAFEMIRKVNLPVYELDLEIYFDDEDIINLYINLQKSFINIKFNSVRKIYLEKFTDFLNGIKIFK